MGKFVTSSNEKIFQIKRFLGINECADGDTNLKMGEASAMTNFRITDDYGLQIRPGTANVAGLLSSYTTAVAGTDTAVATDLNAAASTFTVKPTISVGDTGLLTLSGTPATMTYANHNTYAATPYYYEDLAGNVYKFHDCVYAQPATGTAVTGGNVSLGSIAEVMNVGWQSPYYTLTLYSAVKVVSGAVEYDGTSSANLSAPTATYKYFKYNDVMYEITSATTYNPPYGSRKWYGKAVAYVGNDTYTWNFYAVTATATSANPSVRGIWSGYVGATEFIVAAANGHLWCLTEANDVWAKEDIGLMDTAKGANFFAIDGVLYIQNGVEFKQWDATTYQTHTYTALGTEAAGNYYITVDSVNYKFALASTPTEGDLLVFDESDLSLKLDGVTVEYTTGSVTTETDLTADLVDATFYYDAIDVVGYRPLVRTVVPFGGGGTALEQINKLNGLRRVWLSPDGSHATFQLPEIGLSSIDYVKVLATGAYMTLTTDYTVSTANGTVTFQSNPTSGTNTLEVGYTAATNYRTTVNAMRYAEIFNGTTDNRVFLYGDGSNEAFYSGLDYNGLARADYFPDLNEIKFGDSGTPLTGLIRTYNRMMAFKDNAAFNVSYGSITLVGGTVTAGFYVTPVNKDLGNKALGQACLVDNKPRTLDAGGIYEWSVSNIAGDQLNAQRISQKVGTTLLTFALASTVTYYDKIHHEYYVLYDGKAIVQNTENGAWYIYDGIDATCMIVYQDEVYFGLDDGYIVHFSRDYMGDNGADIECYWESGSMDFDAPYRKKYSAGLWLGIKPEASGSVRVTIVTDQTTDAGEVLATSTTSALSVSGFFSFLDLDFSKLSFNVNKIPTIDCHKLKAKKFTYYKLVFSSTSNNTTATVTNAEIRVRYTGLVR